MKRSPLALNSLWLLLARLGPQALTILFVGVVARRLGEAGLGQYAYVAALLFIGNAFTTFGTDTLVIREVARAGHTRTPFFAASLWIQLGLSTLWLAGLALWHLALPARSPETRLALNLYSLALFPMAFYTLFSATLRAYERMDLFLLLNLLVSLLQTGGAALVLTIHNSLLALCALLLAVQWIAAGLAGAACALLLPNYTWHWRITCAELIAVLRAALALAGLSTLAILSQRLNILLLSVMMGDAATGWFSAAARVVEGMKVGHYAVLGALFPALSRAGREGDPLTAPALRPVFVRLLSLGVGLALIVTLLADPLVALLFGPRFAPSIGALRIVIWSLVPYTLTAVLSLKLVALGAEGAVLKGAAAGLAVSLVFYGLLIPRFGIAGAGWAMLAAECVQAGIFLWLNRWHVLSLRATDGSETISNAVREEIASSPRSLP
jgi:O-antigen/teichoic acid export membrane protein